MEIWKAVSRMGDDELISHIEIRHAAEFAQGWPASGPNRRISDRLSILAYHDFYLHRGPRAQTHDHDAYSWTGWEKWDMTTAMKWVQTSPCNCLHPPQHSPDCTGRQGLVLVSKEQNNSGATGQDFLWDELVSCIDELKGERKDDEGLKGYCRGLTRALAVVRSPHSPSVDGVRKEAMERWRRRHGQ